MYEIVQAILDSSEKNDLRHLMDEFRAQEKQFLLHNEILFLFAEYCQKTEKPTYFYHSSWLGKLINYTHEILFSEEGIWFLVRTRVADQEIIRLSNDLCQVECMSPQALLDLRDRSVNRYDSGILELDFSPFYALLPTVQDPRNIGKGVEFLNRHLCNELFTEPAYWHEQLFKLLQQRQYEGTPLLINDRITAATQLPGQLEQALRCIEGYAPDTPYGELRSALEELGFAPGWGNTAARIQDTLRLLDRFINVPDSAVLEALVARIPLVFRPVLVAIHGWITQGDGVGRSETMGRVTYMLEQARHLESQLWQDIQLAGLDTVGIQPQVTILTRLIPNAEGTSCDQRLEKIQGTNNGWILRVPFREFNSKVTQNWMSRSQIWAYLETFAQDAAMALQTELRGKPDFIIGNYSDGSLVAFLLARHFRDAVLGSIAHSLEKPKHLFSNLYWQDLEDQQHFSLQFTADLINMNAADLVISSSYHEIVGTPDTVGQYESYQCFTMPQLYHVIQGIDLFSSKFNVIPPGVNEQYFFPYHQTDRRSAADRDRVSNLLFTEGHTQALGQLTALDKRPLLSLVPINSIKNPSGLVECFGRSQALRDRCNLILVTNKLQVAEAAYPEEAREIERVHELIDRYQLQGQIRWIGMRLNRSDLSEMYRVIADRQGIFVHSARFESFGLSVLEAMISGLPTFATQFGGPQEVIQNGYNGFHINPMNLEAMAQKILDFLHQCDNEPQYWGTISERAIQHIRERYNWQAHTQQLLLCSKISHFWSYVYPNQREALLRYLETLFHLIYKPRANQLLEQHLHHSVH